MSHNIRQFVSLLIFIISFGHNAVAETKTWTGFGGDAEWSNPLNWSNAGLPLMNDDVLLDNSVLPVSYQVYLPDVAVILKTLHIFPSPGRNIELILPSSNLNRNALSATGPGYGIELNAGAIFRNASGLTSGESLSIADSIMIHDGGRYIHQTKAAHANGILKFLSTAAGTEEGIFDFDVPRSSYTVSVSNRIYGSLEFHSTALGAPVNYTCTGANPLTVRGDLRIGANVTMSMDLSGANGNIQVQGDFIQEGGQMNLASGATDNSICHVQGNLYQSSDAIITESNSGNPVLELDGTQSQAIAMAGKMLNQVSLRINNPAGIVLNLPLTLPYHLILDRGIFYTSSSALLTADVNCDVIADSTGISGSFIDGPFRKLGITGQDFLFPVGGDGNIRWLELKTAFGNYTVEYFRQNPNLLGNIIGSGLDHISTLEYWSVLKDGEADDQSKIELSFSSALSGGVTDPNYLHVAAFQSGEWEDAGQTGITGNSIQGSVLSSAVDFSAEQYTLASTVNLENPLPVISLDLQVTEPVQKILFNWTYSGPVVPEYFNLYEVLDSSAIALVQMTAIRNEKSYSWSCERSLMKGDHYFRVVMIDTNGKEYPGKIVLLKENGLFPKLSLVTSGIPGAQTRIAVMTDVADNWDFDVLSIDGRVIKKGVLLLGSGNNFIDLDMNPFPPGVYVFQAVGSSGKCYSLLFIK